MYRIPLAVFLIGCAFAGTVAQADDGNPSTAVPESQCAGETLKEHKALTKRAFDNDRWRHKSPVGNRTERRLSEIEGCLSARDEKRADRYYERKKQHFKLYRRYRDVATIRCQRGDYGFWAKSCYIIACESGFSWRAYNPSGARGAYQFLGWPVPWPVRNFEDKVEHHEMAAQLGNSHWVCA